MNEKNSNYSLINIGKKVVNDKNESISSLSNKQINNIIDIKSRLLQENELLKNELTNDKISPLVNKDPNKLTAQQYLDRWLNEDNVSFATAFPNLVKKDEVVKDIYDNKSNNNKNKIQYNHTRSNINNQPTPINSNSSRFLENTPTDKFNNDFKSSTNEVDFSPTNSNTNNISDNKKEDFKEMYKSSDINPYNNINQQYNNPIYPINQPNVYSQYNPFNTYNQPPPFYQPPFIPQAPINPYLPPMQPSYNPYVSPNGYFQPNIQDPRFASYSSNNTIKPLDNEINNKNDKENDLSNDLFTLKRDKRINSDINITTNNKLSMNEMKQNEELKNLNFQIEKIKKLNEIELIQSQNEQARIIRMHENEHEQWLIEQKQQIEALRIKEVIIKEQKLLDLLENSNKQLDNKFDSKFDNKIDNNVDNSNSFDYPIIASNKQSNSSMPSYNDLHWEESGVNNQYLPIYILKNCIAIFDGLIIPKHLQSGLIYRIALGIYDNEGKSIVKLSACDWQQWNKEKLSLNELDLKSSRSDSISNSRKPNKIDSNVDDMTMIHYLNKPILKTINVIDNATNDYVINDLTRLLFEIQYKQTTSGSPSLNSNGLINQDNVQSLGWGIMPIAHLIDTNSSIEANKLNNIVLNNGMWRVPIRKGSSDPSFNLSINPISYQAGDIEMLSADQSYGLIRIINGTELSRAISWIPNDNNLSTITDIYRSYIDLSMISHINNVHDQKNDIKMTPIPQSELSIVPPSRTGLTSKGDRIIPPTTANRLGFSPRIKSENRYITPNKTDIKSNRNSEFINKFSDSIIEPTIESSKNLPIQLSSKETNNYWQIGNLLGPCKDKYLSGDGVDLYIDSGRYLPDNTTATRIVVKLFTSSKQQIGQNEESYSQLNSLCIKPNYNMKVEYRNNNKTIDSSIIALIRIDTIDSTNLSTCCLGYSVIRLFSTKDRLSIDINNNTDVYINTGNFQLPIYSGSPNKINMYNDEMLSSLSRIPCSSLLVRIYPAPKSIDGFTVLSRNDYPKDDWMKYKLDIPSPNYSEGSYYGQLCEPMNESELIAYEAKENISQILHVTIDIAISQLYQVNPNSNSLPSQPTDLSNQSIDQQISFIRSLFLPSNQIQLFLDYSFVIPYHLFIGLSMCIDSLTNISDNSNTFSLLSTRTNNSISLIHKVIYSLLPPGSYYKSPPLLDNIFYAKDIIYNESNNKTMKYSNDYTVFTPDNISNTSYIIIDVKLLKINKLNNNMNITFDDKKSYWFLFPIAKERQGNSGYVYVNSGLFQLPLIHGPIPSSVLQSTNPYNEMIKQLTSKSLKLLDYTTVIIKICNTLLFNNLSSNLNDYQYINMKYLIDVLQITNNSNKLDKYVYSNTVNSNIKSLDKLFEGLFPNVSTDVINKSINETFCENTKLSI